MEFQLLGYLDEGYLLEPHLVRSQSRYYFLIEVNSLIMFKIGHVTGVGQKKPSCILFEDNAI
ncbi:hypothetical protein Hanom_Chr07g00653391 [Helianthus anomalus]